MHECELLGLEPVLQVFLVAMGMRVLMMLVVLVAVVVVSLGGHFDDNDLLLRVRVRVRMRVFRLGSMTLKSFIVDVRGIVAVDVGEVLLEDLETPQVFVALGLAVLALGAVLVQDEIQC